MKKAKESVTFSTYFLAFFETMAILSKFEQNSYLILPFRVASDEKNWLFPVLTEKKANFYGAPGGRGSSIPHTASAKLAASRQQPLNSSRSLCTYSTAKR